MTVRDTAFIDIDESLVKTRVLYRETDAVPEGFTEFTVQIQGKTIRAAVKVRPSARQFLEVLSCRCDLHVLTSGGMEFQHAVLTAAGLRDLLGTIYGGDNDDIIPVAGRWVLVDDLKGWMSGIEDKMQRLGFWPNELKDRNPQRLPGGGYYQGPKWQAVLERHLISCGKFLGEEDDEPLTGLFDDIERRLVLQETPLEL